MTALDIPDDYTREQLTTALVALGIGHLEDDRETGVALQEILITSEGIRLVILRKASPYGNESSKVHATIGRRSEKRRDLS